MAILPPLPACGRPASVRIEVYTPVNGRNYGSLDAAYCVCVDHLDAAASALRAAGLVPWETEPRGQLCGQGFDYVARQALTIDEPTDRPCPAWCTVDHTAPDVAEVETNPVIHSRLHVRRVATVDADGGPQRVEVVQLECLDDGKCFPVEVSVGGRHFAPADAERLAAAVVEAARIAQGGVDR